MGNEMEQKESWIFFFFSNLTTRIIINLKKNINESNKLLNKFNDIKDINIDINILWMILKKIRSTILIKNKNKRRVFLLSHSV